MLRDLLFSWGKRKKKTFPSSGKTYLTNSISNKQQMLRRRSL